jgi:hypothetical protein
MFLPIQLVFVGACSCGKLRLVVSLFSGQLILVVLLAALSSPLLFRPLEILPKAPGATSLIDEWEFLKDLWARSWLSYIHIPAIFMFIFSYLQPLWTSFSKLYGGKPRWKDLEQSDFSVDKFSSLEVLEASVLAIDQQSLTQQDIGSDA